MFLFCSSSTTKIYFYCIRQSERGVLLKGCNMKSRVCRRCFIMQASTNDDDVEATAAAVEATIIAATNSDTIYSHRRITSTDCTCSHHRTSSTDCTCSFRRTSSADRTPSYQKYLLPHRQTPPSYRRMQVSHIKYFPFSITKG